MTTGEEGMIKDRPFFCFYQEVGGQLKKNTTAQQILLKKIVQGEP